MQIDIPLACFKVLNAELSPLAARCSVKLVQGTAGQPNVRVEWDDTVPVFSSGETDADGDEITLTYDSALDPESVPAAAQYTINGDDATVNAVDVDGATVVLTLTGAIEFGDTITVDYAVPAHNPVQDLWNNKAAALTAAAITNNVP